MATLPSPTQVAGSHNALFEAYWNQIDPNNSGTVGAIVAARFLKKSGLSDVVLSRIWDLSDPNSRGCLDKAGLFVALKLVSLAQQGRDLNMANVAQEMPPPKLSGPPPKVPPPPIKPPTPVAAPVIPAIPPTAVDWSIKSTEREKYHKLYESLQPLNGLIPGNKVKGVLMDSKLPLETLGKIWDLADMDKDGMLDRHEFIVAMHLVYKALEKHAIPATLPPELLPPNKKPSSVPTTTTPNTPLIAAEAPKHPAAVVPWVVSSEDKIKFDAMFIKADVDKDGYVSGFEIKDVFLQSGVPQAILAQIWALCDIKQTGKLNSEQFALAMWLVSRRLQGIDPPVALSLDMVPPSLRSTVQHTEGATNEPSTVSPYSNPELNMISKDIEELAKEKLALETDIAQKEADIKIKGGEIKSLQSELDTLTAALKQLENQRGEAQKRLNDLKLQVDKLRVQAEEQESALRLQEGDVAKRKEELEGLRKEQVKLEAQCNEQSTKLNSLASTLAAGQLQISQAKAKITQLQEQQRHMKDAILACDNAIETKDVSLVTDVSLRISPDFRDPEFTRIAVPTVQTNAVNNTDMFSSNGFEDDPFKSDPFKNETNSGFSSNDPFTSTSFQPKTENGFDSDPFDKFEPTPTPAAKPDPFDPFGDKSRNATKSPAVDQEEKDAFGCDPFAILHAPTRDGAPPGRPTSPSPALPPKKGKTPPPRPAPPRPSAPPTGRNSLNSTPDPFSAPNNNDPFSNNSSGFANFADFEAKFSTKQSTSILNNNLTATGKKQGLEFKDDPFKDYRYEDIFDIAFEDSNDNFPPSSKGAVSKSDPFAVDFEKDINTAETIFCNKNDGRSSVPLPMHQVKENGRTSVPLATKNKFEPLSEEKQMAWAVSESLKLEETRKRRQVSDFEYDSENSIF